MTIQRMEHVDIEVHNLAAATAFFVALGRRRLPLTFALANVSVLET